MSGWDWIMLLGAIASIAGLILYLAGYFGAAEKPNPPPQERIEPTHAEPEPATQPAPSPPGNEIDATNVTDTEIIGGSHGTQPRNTGPNKIKVTNADGSRIVGGNDRS